MAVCPKCGSNNVTFQLRHAGTTSTTNYYRTGVKSSVIFPAGRKTRSSQTHQKSVGLCQSCGYSWVASAEKSGWFYLLCILFFPITLIVLLVKAIIRFVEKPSDRLTKKQKLWIVWGAVGLFFIIGMINAIVTGNL